LKFGREPEIRALDAEIRHRNAEARKISILEEKVRDLKLLKKLEKSGMKNAVTFSRHRTG
jgi:hypothetical protein